MRTIPYVCGAAPANLDDCLDYCARVQPENIRADLKTRLEEHEFCLIRYLVACFRWEFRTIAVEYIEVLGGCFSHESPKRQRLSVDNANGRLGRRLERIREAGLFPTVRPLCFDYSTTFINEEAGNG